MLKMQVETISDFYIKTKIQEMKPIDSCTHTCHSTFISIIFVTLKCHSFNLRGWRKKSITHLRFVLSAFPFLKRTNARQNKLKKKNLKKIFFCTYNNNIFYSTTLRDIDIGELLCHVRGCFQEITTPRKKKWHIFIFYNGLTLRMPFSVCFLLHTPTYYKL